MIRNASAKAITEANSGSKTRASTCSPRAPIARLAPVTPSCIAAMKRGGSATIRSTARADEAFQVRERLGKRETPVAGVEVLAEEGDRDLEAGSRPVGERGGRRV